MKFNIFSGAKNFRRPTTFPPCTVNLPQFFIPKIENLPKKPKLPKITQKNYPKKYLALYTEIFNPNISPAD
jgi:hypothetical protein